MLMWTLYVRCVQIVLIIRFEFPTCIAHEDSMSPSFHEKHVSSFFVCCLYRGSISVSLIHTNCLSFQLLVDWTRGKNLIICSAATSATELRGPQDVANLFSLLRLPREHAKAAISSNCRCVSC